MSRKFDKKLLAQINIVFERFMSEFKSSEDYCRTIDKPLMNPGTLPAIFSFKNRFMIIKSFLVNTMSRQLRKRMDSVKGIDDVWAVPIKSCQFLKHGECEELSKTLMATLLESGLAIQNVCLGAIISESNQYGTDSTHAFVIVEDRKKNKFILDPFFRISCAYEDYFAHEKLLSWFRAKQENPDWAFPANAQLRVHRQSIDNLKTQKHMRYLEQNRDHKTFKSIIDMFQQMVELPDTPEGFRALIPHFKRGFIELSQEKYGTDKLQSLAIQKMIDGLEMLYSQNEIDNTWIDRFLSDFTRTLDTGEPCQRPETYLCRQLLTEKEEKSSSSAQSQVKASQVLTRPDTRYLSVGGLMARRPSSDDTAHTEVLPTSANFQIFERSLKKIL